MGWISKAQQKRDHSGLRNVCAACGRDGSAGNPLELDNSGFRIHKSHLDAPKSGLFGHRQKR